MVQKVAITGNIASGKSQVEKYLKKKGYPVYDTDIIAHEILDSLTEFYGYDVFINGKIDRKKLGELVFSNKDIKKKLENIVHPKVKSRLFELFNLHQTDKYIFVSVPLLFEAGFEELFDKIIFIAIDEELQLSRLMARNGFTQEEALSRINSQIPQKKKISKADFVIYNNSTIEYLSEQIDKIFRGK